MHLVNRICLPVLVMLAAACSGPTVVNTEDAAPSAEDAAPPAPSPTRPSNARLVNAFDYAVRTDGTTVYAFTSPSGRWQCTIEPRARAACQKAASPLSAIGITGAPDEVIGADGESDAPNALVVDRTADPRFARLAAPPTADTGKATELPFDRILAVAGFRCNVQESVGISCLSEFSGKGFTFSAENFTMTYTDLPPGAP